MADSENLRMDAYYYRFDSTGRREIDLILSAVACAGKAYHHTDSWNDEFEFEPYEGKTPVEWIQNAANEAAAEIERLTRERDEALAGDRAETAALHAQITELRRRRIVYSPDAKALSDRCVAAEAALATAREVDCLGFALDLETQAKRVESQTVERSMLLAATALKNIHAVLAALPLTRSNGGE